MRTTPFKTSPKKSEECEPLTRPQGGRSSLLAAFVAASCVLWASDAFAVVVEVNPQVERWVEGPFVRRLIQLELSDVDVPPPPGAEQPEDAPELYVRLIRARGRVLVELWDRGQLRGSRRLSPSDYRQLTARRIALAAGELALRLRERRLAQLRAFEREQRRLVREAAAPKPLRILGRPFIAAELQVAALPSAEGWLFGPRFIGGLRLDNGVEFAFSGDLLSGGVGVGSQPSLQLFEFAVAPGYWASLSPGWQLRFGANASVATAHFINASVWQEPGSVGETWTARATGELRAAWSLDKRTRLTTSLEAGSVLRRIWLEDAEGERFGVGGLWLGVGVGVDLQ